ncbi:MAG TPA: glycosyltransferase [Candidatus Omnitrophota bacterium]|nr:glycosyltransferase [Candidatus Omnitrophota bacterium]
MAKNILYIADTGRTIGGGEISLLNLLESLDRERVRPVVCVPGEGDWSSRVREMNIPVHLFTYKRVANPFNLTATAAAVRAVRDIIRRESIDLVHTNATGGIVAVAGIACLLEKKPLVSHIRLVYTGFFQDICQAFLSAKIIIISRRLGRKKSFMFFQRKLALVYNGVNMARFSPDAARADLRKSLGIPGDAFVAGAAGAYTPGKGFEYLIKAAGILKQKIPGMRILVAGFQPAERARYVERLERQARKAGVEETIRFLGKCEDMAAFFKAVDVFVFPSLIDPFGRVLIEAIACSKPIVSFATGGAPEIIEDGKTGWLVRPRDHKAFAEKVVFFQDREAALRFGAAGYERCERMFGIAAHAVAVQKVYLEVLKDASLGYIRCPICGSGKYSTVNSCAIAEDDAVIEEKILFLRRCRVCGLVYVNPQPRALDKNAEGLYTQEYFQKGYMRFYGNEKDGGAAVQSNEPFSLRIDLIKRFKPAGSLLDIGCASGEFMKAAQDAGFRVSGIDISAYAAGAAKQRYGFDVKNCGLSDAHFPEGSFDVVTAGDVLEHIPGPLGFLREIRRILKPDGILYVAVPDFGSLHYRAMSFLARFNHKNYFVLPHHVFHFTAATLEKLLNRAGFAQLEARSTESRIQEQGMRRIFMKALFGFGRMMRMKDRLIMIGALSCQTPAPDA